MGEIIESEEPWPLLAGFVIGHLIVTPLGMACRRRDDFVVEDMFDLGRREVLKVSIVVADATEHFLGH